MAVIGLDDVEALNARSRADRRRRRPMRGRDFLVGELEVAGEDRSAFEADVLDRVERRGAAAGFEILGDEALRVLSSGGICGAADQQRGKSSDELA